MRRFDLVIFDCDGVLVDSEPVSIGVLRDYLNELGGAIDFEETMRVFVGRSIKEDLELTRRVLGRDPPDEFHGEFVRRRDAALSQRVEPVPGVRAAIDALSLPYCVASGADIGKMRVTLGRTGLAPLFEGKMYSANDVERSKPAPDVYLYAASNMGVAPARCVVIEDTPTGTMAGVSAGMTVLGYCDRQDPRELLAAGAAAVFDDMRRLSLLVR